MPQLRDVIEFDNIDFVPSGSLLTRSRRRAGLSKRALARRVGTSPAAIVLIEADERDPGVGTLARCLEGTGHRLELHARPAPDARTAADRLVQVLALADALPHRPAARTLRYPRLPQ